MPKFFMHSFAKFQSPPISELFFCLCDKVYLKQEARFLICYYVSPLWGRHIVFALSVCPSGCLSVRPSVRLSHLVSAQ